METGQESLKALREESSTDGVPQTFTDGMGENQDTDLLGSPNGDPANQADGGAATDFTSSPPNSNDTQAVSDGTCGADVEQAADNAAPAAVPPGGASGLTDLPDSAATPPLNFEQLLARRAALGLPSAETRPYESHQDGEALCENAPAAPLAEQDTSSCDDMSERRYSTEQANILEMLHEQMRELTQMAQIEESVGQPADSAQTHFLTDHNWDVGSMSEAECERIVAAAPLGNFLARIDLDVVPNDVELSKVNWALYISEKGRSTKFPISATVNGFDFMGRSYLSLEEIVEYLRSSDLPLLEGDTGRKLRPTFAAHDRDAWLSTTSFCVGAVASVTPQDDTGSECEGAESALTEANPVPTSLAAEAAPAPAEEGPAGGAAQANIKENVPWEHGGAFAASGSGASPDAAKSTKILRMSQSQEDDFVIVEDHFEDDARSPSPDFLRSIDELLEREERLTAMITETNLSQNSMSSSTPSARVQGALVECHEVRLKLRTMLEKMVRKVSSVEEDSVIVTFAGHRFIECAESERPCDVCLKPATKKFLSNTTANAYSCSACKIVVHRKCQQMVSRRCIAAATEALSVETRICPDNEGLAAQEYKCDDCRVDIGFQGSVFAEARVCDYLGRYMCPDCHRLDEETIPARVLLNWDFKPRPVSRRAREMLAILYKQPTIDLMKVNARLASHVEEVLEFSRLRQSLITMNKFLRLCRVASAQPDLILSLSKRPHLCESARLVSISDLVEIKNGTLNDELRAVTANCEKHITKECVLCQARGSYCELCRSNQLIFPFSPSTTQCKECKALFHTACWSKAIECPKCVRIRLYALKRERKKDPDFLEA